MTHAAPPRAGSRPGALRYSMFSVFDHYPDRDRSLQAFYAEAVAQCVLAEQLGYDSFFVAEHHFDQYGVAPNPAVMLSHLAALTRDIRLGSAIAVLTFHHPFDVAENYAMLDVLSGGRVTLGVGSGYLKHEFAGYGIDPKEKRERYDEALGVVKQALASDRVSHAGRFFRIDDVKVQIRPLQRPTLPMYVAVSAIDVAYHVGRQGNNMMIVPYSQLERVEQVGEALQLFARGHAEFLAAGGDKAQGGDVITAFHAHVAASDEECRAHAAAPFELYLATRQRAKHQTYEKIAASGLALLGSVDTVVAKMLRLHEVGVRHVMLMHNFGLMPAEHAESSMRLFANEVVPRVNAALARQKAA